MNALASPALTPATCLELDAYLHDTRHRLSPSEIANLERRIAKHRRADDLMIDDCKFD